MLIHLLPRSFMTRPARFVASLAVCVALLALTARPALAGFQTHQTFDVGGGPFSVAAADLNGDGKPDLVVGNQFGNTVSVLLNTTATTAGTPSFAAQQTFATGVDPVSVAAADLNGDHVLDLVVANYSSDTVSVLLNTTATNASTFSFAAQQTFATGSSPPSVAAVDLNGDGKPDLAAVNSTDATVSVLLNMTATNASTFAFSAQQTFATGAGPGSVAAADLNGDGKPDLAAANFGHATVSVLLAVPSGDLQFSSASLSVAEGAGTAIISITRTGSTDGQVTAIVNSVPGSVATQGFDYSYAGSQTVTWADGDGADKTVSILIISDDVDEGDEQLQLSLSLPSNPFGATLVGQSTTALTIVDDDSPSLSIANVSQAEGNSGDSAMTFVVTRTGSLTRTATVQYATANGSATAGTDYTTTSGTLTFAPTESSKTIAVPILGDTLYEPDETFTVTLSSPTNAVLGTAQAVGVIQNDDVVVACTPRPSVTQTLAAGGGALNVHVQSTALNTQQNNPLISITFGAYQNATVTLNGQPVSSGQAVSLPANTFAADLVVQRVTPGQPTTVHMTVVDGCGPWQTFVGGGTGAGF